MTTLAVAFDWSFVIGATATSFWTGLTPHARGLGDRDRRRVRRSGSSSARRAPTAIPVVSQLAAIYVEIIRNTPILVQIFFLFFALPQTRASVLEPFTVAWLAVTIWGGAFNTENFRAGFEAVPVALP